MHDWGTIWTGSRQYTGYLLHTLGGEASLLLHTLRAGQHTRGEVGPPPHTLAGEVVAKLLSREVLHEYLGEDELSYTQ